MRGDSKEEVIERQRSYPFNKSIFMTTHNSYSYSIKKQLNYGIRAFEIDIHDWWSPIDVFRWWFTSFPTVRKIRKKFFLNKVYKVYYQVGHYMPGHEVYNSFRQRLKGGNPRGNNLGKWLGIIGNWSKKNRNHAPITVFIDLKRELISNHMLNNLEHEHFGLIRLDEQIEIAFGENLFTPKQYENLKNQKQGDPITIEDLQGKIIVVLMSFHTLTTKAEKKIADLQKQLSGKRSFLSRIYRNIVIKIIRKGYANLIRTGVAPDGHELMKTRIAYQKAKIKDLPEGSEINFQNNFKQLCFIAFNDEDRKNDDFVQSLEDNSLFVTIYPPESFQSHWKKGRLVRTDLCRKVKPTGRLKKIWTYLLWTFFLRRSSEVSGWDRWEDYVNFPATDYWEPKHRYVDRYEDWIIDEYIDWKIFKKPAPPKTID